MFSALRGFPGLHIGRYVARRPLSYFQTTAPVAMDTVHQESIHIPCSDNRSGDKYSLHLRRFWSEEAITRNPPVAFCLHGAMENGKIFYPKKWTGLAPFLAQRGFEVYVGDLRGRGGSSPAIGAADSSYGQHEAITEEIGAFLSEIKRRRPQSPQLWGAHSWGGVLLTAYYARYPEEHPVKASVYFASKRHISVRSMEKIFMIDMLWDWVFPCLGRAFGYVPTKKFGFPDNETTGYVVESGAWVRSRDEWSCRDGFDYHSALARVTLPPTLYLAGKNDRILGNPIDVKLLMEESGHHRSRYELLSKERGYQRDYDHVDILAGPTAEADVFEMVMEWVRDLRHLQS